MQWLEQQDAQAGAALAYYSIFSIGPLIAVAISVASLVFARQGMQAEVATEIKGLAGRQGRRRRERDADERRQAEPKAISSPSIIAARLRWFLPPSACSRRAEQVVAKEAMNAVWDVKKPPGKGLWGFVRTYVFSFAGVLAIGFLLLVSDDAWHGGLAAFSRAWATSFQRLSPKRRVSALSFAASACFLP